MRWRAAGFTLIAGLTLILVAQLRDPVGSLPLYDGVIVQEPYRYLTPQPGQAGSPSSYTGNQRLHGASSPAFVAATTESPPQAQLISPVGAFAVPADAAALAISIQPVADPPSSPDGPIVGNTYRFMATAPTGAAVPIDAATPPSVVLRAPDTALDATIARYQGGVWQNLPTQATGQPGIFVANVDALADFALIGRRSAGIAIDPALIAIAAGIVIAVALVGFVIRSNRTERNPRPIPPRPRPTPRCRRGGRRRSRR